MMRPSVCKSHAEVVKSSKKSSEFKMSRWGGLDGRLVPERPQKAYLKLRYQKISKPRQHSLSNEGVNSMLLTS